MKTLVSDMEETLHRSRISCPACQVPLASEWLNTEDLVACASCGRAIQVHVFPAFYSERPTPTSGQPMVSDTDAGCFYHPSKRAEVVCDMCGRFLCALCDVSLQGKHLCIRCLESSKSKDQLPLLETSRIRFDRLALFLVLFPILTLVLAFTTVVTVPVAIYLTIKYWNAPLSIVKPNRIRYILTWIVGAIEIIGWSLIFLGKYG